MPNWRQLEAEARIISWRNNCSAEWAKLADFYKEMAEKESAKERGNGQLTQDGSDADR